MYWITVKCDMDYQLHGSIFSVGHLGQGSSQMTIVSSATEATWYLRSCSCFIASQMNYDRLTAVTFSMRKCDEHFDKDTRKQYKPEYHCRVEHAAGKYTRIHGIR